MRQTEALKLRIKGLSFREIGTELGIDVSGAHQLVMKALRHTQEHNIEQAIELRALELLRLDGMQATLTGIIEKAERLANDDDLGTSEAVILQTLDRLLRVIEKRAKLLGIDLATDAEAELRAPWVAVLSNMVALNNERTEPPIPPTVVPADLPPRPALSRGQIRRIPDDRRLDPLSPPHKRASVERVIPPELEQGK